MQEDKIYQGEDIIEINLMDLFWLVLRHWRSILITMVFAAVLLAGFGAFKEYRHLTNETFVKEQQETYESDLEAYELKKKQLERKLENLEEDLVRQEFYEKNAVMLLFDPYNVYLQTVSYYINTGYEIAPELYFQNPNYTGVITNSYKSAIDRIDLDAIIASEENPDLTARNPISGAKKMLNTSVDAGKGVLTITICGDTEERVQKIFEAVKKAIAEQEVLLNRVIGEHTVQVLSEKSYVDIDTDFGTLQTSFDDKSEYIAKGIEETKQALDDLIEPVNETPTKASVIKQGIKYSAIGALVGLLLLGGFYLVKLILQDKVSGSEDIRRRYKAPILGAICNQSGKQRKLDKLFAEKLGMPAGKSIEDQMQFVASNIRLYLKDQKKILLVGNCMIDELNTIGEQLGRIISDAQIIVGGNVNDDPKAINALNENKTTVICVEKWAKTLHRDIRHEVKTINASGNANLGFILVD